MRYVITLIGCLLITGCAGTYTRAKLDPAEETQFHFEFTNTVGRATAFQRAQVKLATTYNDYQKVRQLEQPETGTIIVKPVYDYWVLTAQWFNPYTLKIAATDQQLTLDFQLYPSDQYGAWPPRDEMPRIKSRFAVLAVEISAAVNAK